MRGRDIKPGDEFGRLTVIEEIPLEVRGGRKRLFKFKCRCGNEITTSFGITESCGCLQREVAGQTIAKTRRKSFGEAQFNAVYCGVLNRATRDGIEFRLTREESKGIMGSDCFYCGIPPAMIAKAGRNRKSYGNYIHNGIDRVNSSEGYTVANTVACCTQCNTAKHAHTQQEFYDWVKRIHAHLIFCGILS